MVNGCGASRGYGIRRDIAFGRRHDCEFRRELPIARAAQFLHEANTHLRSALVSVAPVSAKERGLEQVHHCAGAVNRPVLSGFKEDVGVRRHGPIESAESQTQLERIAANGGNVAVVSTAEVTLVIAFDLA